MPAPCHLVQIYDIEKIMHPRSKLNVIEKINHFIKLQDALLSKLEMIKQKRKDVKKILGPKSKNYALNDEKLSDLDELEEAVIESDLDQHSICNPEDHQTVNLKQNNCSYDINEAEDKIPLAFQSTNEESFKAMRVDESLSGEPQEKEFATKDKKAKELRNEVTKRRKIA